MPESKNEEHLEVNIVVVTDLTDRVSLPATSCKIDSIHAFFRE